MGEGDLEDRCVASALIARTVSVCRRVGVSKAREAGTLRVESSRAGAASRRAAGETGFDGEMQRHLARVKCVSRLFRRSAEFHAWPRQAGLFGITVRQAIPPRLAEAFDEYERRLEHYTETAAEQGVAPADVVRKLLAEGRRSLPHTLAQYAEADGRLFLCPRALPARSSPSQVYASVFTAWLGVLSLLGPDRPVCDFFRSLSDSLTELTTGLTNSLALELARQGYGAFVPGGVQSDAWLWVVYHASRYAMALTMVNDWPGHPDREMILRFCAFRWGDSGSGHYLYSFLLALLRTRWEAFIAGMWAEAEADPLRVALVDALRSIHIVHAVKLTMDTLIYQHGVLAACAVDPTPMQRILSEAVIA